MATIYLVRTGGLENDRVSMEPVVGFTTKREAETVVREAKREDAYTHQYDDVLPVQVYRRRTEWKKGEKLRAKKRAGRP